MMYLAYQNHTDLLSPLQAAASTAASYLSHEWFVLKQLPAVRKVAAACEVFSLAKLTHQRPDFRISSVRVGERELKVREEVVTTTPFATLLRDHDVYITDWHNARHVPLVEGPFGLDEYIEHLILFLETMGPGSHLMAICQPCVPALAAVALMSEDDNPAQPRSMSLMAGPIDCRINPTEVNKLATSKPIEWFEKNLVHDVPLRYAGAMRRVYPGFLQLTAFMSMNPDRHRKAFADLYHHIATGDIEKAEATRQFYEEYFAVNDLAAEFYLETVKLVFQDYALARGELNYRGRKVDTKAIRRTALFTVEGERDDICSIGQTVAAHDLCGGLAPFRKTHHVQLGVGHYGVFSGRRWQQQIYPRVRELIHVSQ